jgi:hypothetical protein
MTTALKKTIPRQHKGARSDVKHIKRFSNEEQAIDFFPLAKKRLLHVSQWGKLCKGLSASFTLTDIDGNEVNRAARVNDHFKIAIPGPGSKTGDGYDWVKIQAITNSETAHHEEQLSMTVSPAPNPQNKDPEAAHFFKEGATSTFMVIRRYNEIRAEVHGRNELPNTHPRRFFDRLRNILVALLAMLGLSSTQWKKLTRGLVDPTLKL